MLLERFFELGNDGEFHQKRLGKERDFVRKRSEKQKENINKRWSQYNKNNSICDTMVIPSGNPPTPTPTPIEEKRDTILSPKKSAPRGTRLPDDWMPGDEGMQFANKEGFTNEDANRMLASFRDYWKSATGSNATKLDWDATWRNWVRRNRADAKRTPRRNDIPANGERVGPLTAALRKFTAEAEAENDIWP